MTPMTPSEQIAAQHASTVDPAAIPDGHFALASSSLAVEKPPAASLADSPKQDRNGWTLVLISIGISLIACCLLIPQADENRQQLYQCEKLQADLHYLQKQEQVNQEFIKQVNQDPTLVERLAQRQLRLIPKGTTTLDLPGDSPSDLDRSPFVLVTVPTPPPFPECPRIGGTLADLCRDARIRLYMIGGGLMLMAAGLVLGYSPKSSI